MKIIYRFIPATIIVILISLLSVSAQDTAYAPAKLKRAGILDRIDFGGYLGAQFGTVTIVDVSPIATYRFTDKFHGGLGFTYQFYKDTRYTPDYTSNAYGGSIFGRYFIWKDLFAHMEYAPLYVTYYDYFDNGSGGYTRVKGSVWVHDFLIGGGYRQMVGDRAYMSVMMLFNVNESYYSPYRNPIIRIGFGVGL